MVSFNDPIGPADQDIIIAKEQRDRIIELLETLIAGQRRIERKMEHPIRVVTWAE